MERPLEEVIGAQALSVDLRVAVMACLSGGESRRWTLSELVERLKNLCICATKARVTAALASLSLPSGRPGAWSNEDPNGSWFLNQRAFGFISQSEKIAG
jgi:hypothetical protein